MLGNIDEHTVGIGELMLSVFTMREQFEPSFALGAGFHRAWSGFGMLRA